MVLFLFSLIFTEMRPIFSEGLGLRCFFTDFKKGRGRQFVSVFLLRLNLEYEKEIHKPPPFLSNLLMLYRHQHVRLKCNKNNISAKTKITIL